MATEPPCVNLQELFGNRYRVGHDEAAQTWGERRDPWMMTIPCEKGIIYPHGGDRLAVEVDGRPITVAALRKLDGVTVAQQGDHEVTLLFPVSMFDTVAAIIKPRKRRRLTEAQRVANAARLKDYLFKPGRSPDAPQPSRNAEEPQNVPEATPGPIDVPAPVSPT